MNITGIVLSHNDESVIVACLESIKFVDELIVIDDQSSDRTVELATAAGAKVITHSLEDFAAQRNFALAQAKNEWVLFLDSDERISSHLREALRTIEPGDHLAFNFLRRNVFLGKEMLFGGWQDDIITRLIQKQRARFVNPIHEVCVVDGTTGTLPGIVFHFSHRSIAESMFKTVQYAKLQSTEMLGANYKKITRWNLFVAVIAHFVYRYFLRGGWRDGMEGFVEAMYQAFSQIFVIRTMLWEKQRGRSVDDIYRDLDQQLLTHDFDEHALR